MTTLKTAFVIALLAAGPAMAQTMIDLPHLTWPEGTTAEPVTQGCHNPALPVSAGTCAN